MITADLFEKEDVEEIANNHQDSSHNPWETITDLVLPDVMPLLPLLREEQLPVPDVGFEPLGTHERVIGTAELAWPESYVALLLPDQMYDRAEFEANGWQVVPFAGLHETALALKQALK